jgi:hypothetical protein
VVGDLVITFLAFMAILLSGKKGRHAGYNIVVAIVVV